MKKYGLFIFMIILLLTSCAPLDASVAKTDSSAVVKQEQAKQAENQSKYVGDTPNMGSNITTLERTNLRKRMENWNDPNKIGYIYEIGQNGNIIAFYTIKGKVSSLNSYLTGSETIVKDPNCDPAKYEGGTCSSLLMESPDFDGSYGNNGSGIFFFLTDGTYMEWNGLYQLSDQPMKLSAEPLMTYDAKEK